MWRLLYFVSNSSGIIVLNNYSSIPYIRVLFQYILRWAVKTYEKFFKSSPMSTFQYSTDAFQNNVKLFIKLTCVEAYLIDKFDMKIIMTVV